MPENQDNTPNQNPGATMNSFNKGMVKDYNESFVPEGMWTHARNSVNNTHSGQVGVIGNEPSNLFCVNLPYSLIGTIHLYEDQWAVFTTDDYDSEIGIFDESDCSYTKVVNDQCLGFKRTHLITGAFRERYDCERLVYFDDGLNPTRVLDIDNVPFITTKKIVNDCVVETPTDRLDCEAIRLASLITYPCLVINKGRGAGTLPNGSYQVCMAYTINQVRVTDYIGMTEVQGLFSHENMNGSLEVKVETIDKDFDEFELVIISNVNAQTSAVRLGYYSTNLSTIYIDRIDSEAVTVPISDIVLRTEPIEKSDAMYPVGDYLLRVGIYSKFRFNYQPQANKITTKWVAVQYPDDYYHSGGNNTGYMRDEQYPFFIRWIYNTGDRSDSYHIPGRIATADDKSNYGGTDAYELANGVNVKKWQVQNTAKATTVSPYTLPDGGKVVSTGIMGYWESTERYPDDKPEIWGELCGKPIRHHKFPDETVDDALKLYSKNDKKIVLLGVQFSNITPPLDNEGNPIESIVGYEILRGSREGNKTVLSKGLINNMREYTIPGNTDVKGLYQNYPYNDLRADDYLTATPQLGNNAVNNLPKLSKYKKNIFSFHGPEITFSNPYLDGAELKVYQEVYGQSIGHFTTPYRHPRFKVPGPKTTLISTILAAVSALVKLLGAACGADGTLQLGATGDIGLTSDLLMKHRPEINYGWFQVNGYTNGGGAFGTVPVVTYPGNPAGSAAAAKRNGCNTAISIGNGVVAAAMTPLVFSAQQQQLYNIIFGFLPKRQYAAQYISHGFYDEADINVEGNRRRKIVQSRYVRGAVTGFNTEYQINNLLRSSIVAVEIDGEIANPTNVDNSRFTLARTSYTLEKSVTSDISSYYAAIKIPIPSQYGQLESIKQMIVSNCIQNTTTVKGLKYTSPVFFNGDVYINRFTEKNSMFFFDNWLMGEPDLYEIDYTLYSNVPYPRYWLNTTQYHSEFIASANKYKSLDGEQLSSSKFYVNKGYFYLFNSGVRDFFVESEINLAYRDWDDVIGKRHYDPYTFVDLQSMFRSDHIRDGNYYKYDYSLSISKQFSSHITWGNIFPRDYNPVVAETCYTYRSTRVMYSLPLQYQAKKDNWRAFLANNYTDFVSPVTSIKPINMTGALFMMYNASPLKFMGVEELKLDATGTKIKVGDGGLFSQDNQLQSLVNADQAYEYGSCQGKYGVAGTKYGVFWVSQNQGKVYQYVGGGLNEISDNGMRWWFAKYLPSPIMTKFPNYKYGDNPLIGIGVNMIYDNTNDILYITKKDYKPIIDLSYEEDTGRFYSEKTGRKVYYDLGNPLAFDDASWTISYDPKIKSWISFHDWIPSFLMPGKNHFMSVLDNSIWKHNMRCDSYCNFYNKDYPWEVEFVSSTGQMVTTMRNIEYLLEAYKYFNDCADKFHILDENFDEGIVYNSEQISGLLKLHIKPKNNPVGLLSYPNVTANYIDILFSKEENKYRFNQFWDITRDRLEFNTARAPIPMFNTEANGYKFDINLQYINYGKDPLQRKKFRHYVNRVFLRKKVSADTKFLFKLSNQKIQQSFR